MTISGDLDTNNKGVNGVLSFSEKKIIIYTQAVAIIVTILELFSVYIFFYFINKYVNPTYVAPQLPYIDVIYSFRLKLLFLF